MQPWIANLIALALILAAALIGGIYFQPWQKENLPKPLAHIPEKEHSHEGRVELTHEAILENAIEIDQAGPINLNIKLVVMGKIVPNLEQTAYISPRFPGIVKAVHKKLGDAIHKGEVLALIESNESLQNYEVKSEISGQVIKKEINLGMFLSGQENIFIISDLKTVWADFNIYRKDLPQVKVGDPIEVINLEGNLKQLSSISYISPMGNETTQSVIARAVLSNPEGVWRPGLFVSGEIIIDQAWIPVSVKESSLQTFRDMNVVFLFVDNAFRAVPVKPGRRSQGRVEILSGLLPGDLYASENSFILKADLEKSSAAHEHE